MEGLLILYLSQIPICTKLTHNHINFYLFVFYLSSQWTYPTHLPPLTFPTTTLWGGLDWETVTDVHIVVHIGNIFLSCTFMTMFMSVCVCSTFSLYFLVVLMKLPCFKKSDRSKESKLGFYSWKVTICVASYWQRIITRWNSYWQSRVNCDSKTTEPWSKQFWA